MASIYGIFEHLAIIIETIILLIFSDMFLYRRHRSQWQFAIPIVFISVVQRAVDVCGMPFDFLKLCISLSLDFLLLQLYYKGAVAKKLFVLIGFFLLSAVTQGIAIGLVASVTDISTSNVVDTDNEYVYPIVALYLITMMFCVMFCERFRKVKAVPLSTPVWLGLLLIPTTSLLVVWKLFPFNKYDVELDVIKLILFFSFFLLLFNLFIFILYREIANHSSLVIRHQSLLDIVRMERRHYEEKISVLEKLRDYIHDYLHNLTFIASLLDTEQIQEAICYIDKLTGRLRATHTLRYTGNRQVDALLSDKAARIEDMGVCIVVRGALPDSLGWDNLDLCMLLGNAIDNATESCARQEMKGETISIGFLLEGEYLLIEISNPITVPPSRDFATCKPDVENHGRGMAIMRQVVEKYNGNLIVNTEDDHFVLSALLQLPETP